MGVKERVWSWILKRAPVPLMSAIGGEVAAPPISRQALEAYRGWVYAAVRKVALSAAMVDIKLYRSRKDRRGRDIDEPVWRHPLVDLIERPNPHQTRFEFKFLTFSWLELMGEAYWAKVFAGDPRRPRELWPLRPDRVRIALDENGGIAGYVYYAENGEKVPFEPDEIVPFRLPNPARLYRGMGIVEAAATAIDTDHYAANWHKSFFRHGTMLGGVLETDQFLPESELQRIKQEFAQKYSGPQGAGKIPVLTAGLKWKDTSQKIVDMQLIEGRRFNRDEILSAAGISQAVLGIMEDVNRANAEGAIFLLMATEIAPRLQLFDETLNAYLVPDFGDENLWFKHDDPVPENREIRAKELELLSARGAVLLNELREAYGFQPDPRFDVALAPLNLTPLGSSPPEKGQKAINLKTEEQKAAYWRSVEDRRERWVKKVSEMVRRRLREERAAVLEAVRKATPETAAQAADEALNGERSKWLTLLTAIYAGVAEDFGEQVLAQLKGVRPSEVKQFGLDRIIRALEQIGALLVTRITETTREELRAAIIDAVNQFQDIDRIAKAIDEAVYLEPIIERRSEVIARTETIRASNLGGLEGARQSGLPLRKEWIATRDGREREAHRAADGQIVGLEEPFIVGGEKLMYPVDPVGSPGNVINCRCTLAFVVEGDE